MSTPMQCPRCCKVIDFSGDPPSFCAYCGHALAKTVAVPSAEAATLAPNPPSPVWDEQPPTNVGGYRLLRKLGAGGMGAVWEAEQTATGRRVAIKLISAAGADDPDAVERFRREGRIASQIAHPRCVFVLAADEDAGRPYLIMDLMPGDTLADQVSQRGPRPLEEALRAILDVIDGLSEAHSLGIVHRDVKPSNCFLDTDGRVKVGDFGLARTIISDARLTGTGVFLGTPLYASPEQVKQQTLDARSDLYSVAATLYFLLAGKAPFESDNAALTLARIVSDPVPPLRPLRPDVPAALERMILRGLERDRERRWQSLDEFRAALLPFLPDQQSLGGLGLRLGAYLIDYSLLELIWVPFDREMFEELSGDADLSLRLLIPLSLTRAIIWIVYFTVLESVWGCTLGKWLARLRVRAAHGLETPGLGRTLVRSLVHTALVLFPSLVLSLFPPVDPLAQALWALACLLLPIPGALLVMATMRATNGYRGAHEWLSATRVVRLPWPERRRCLTAPATPMSQVRDAWPVDLPTQVGAFHLVGVLWWSSVRRVVEGEDSVLGRRVWVEFRPADEPPLDDGRRDLCRSTRLRWLAEGQVGSWRWDAYLAPAGAPLSALVASDTPLTWAEARSLLQQLADEVTAACNDGSLPRALSARQVWVQKDARTRLLDWPLADDAPEEALPANASDEERGLILLRDVAVLGLEGNSWDARRWGGKVLPSASDALGCGPLLLTAWVTARLVRGTPGIIAGLGLLLLLSIAYLLYLLARWQRRRLVAQQPLALRAPVPAHAVDMLDRLLGSGEPYDGPAQFQADLAATRDRPAEVSTPLRAGQLGLTAVFAVLGLVCMFLPPRLVSGAATGVLADHVHNTQRAAKLLDEGDLEAFVQTRMGPDETLMIGFLEIETLTREEIVQQFGTPETHALLRGELERGRDELALRLRNTNRMNRYFWKDEIAKAKRCAAGEEPVRLDDFTVEEFLDAAVGAHAAAGGSRMSRTFEILAASFNVTVLLAWPFLWVFCAWLFGDSLSWRIVGITLVASTGHRPLRLQYAARALLVWGPIAILLAVSLWVDFRYPFWPWISWIFWWAALALLPMYTFLALRYPARGPHDRWAGTYLVPR